MPVTGSGGGMTANEVFPGEMPVDCMLREELSVAMRSEYD